MIIEDLHLGKDVDVTPGVSLNRVHTGNGGKIRDQSILFGGPGKPLTIGDDFYVGARCYFNGVAGLAIGDRVTFAVGVMIFTDSGPNTSPWLQQHYPIEAAPVRIGSDVWIGAGAILLPGAVIGEKCVIGAGSVVKGEIPAGSVAVGSPAKVIKTLL